MPKTFATSVTDRAPQAPPARQGRIFSKPSQDLARKPDVAAAAARLSAQLNKASPEQIIKAALEAVAPGRFALVSSFGTESAVLLHAAAQANPSIPVLLLDTHYLFPETLAYRDTLVRLLGLRDVRSIEPDPMEISQQDQQGDLWSRSPDACCVLRKVRPLFRALAPFDAWANGRKRYQGSERSAIPVVEADGSRLKFNPLAALSPEEITGRFKTLDLPPHPLERHGFTSIGCMPCTTRVKPGEDVRAGRWRGNGKRECGIHLPQQMSLQD